LYDKNATFVIVAECLFVVFQRDDCVLFPSMKKVNPRGIKKSTALSKKLSKEELEKAKPEIRALAELIWDAYMEERKRKRHKPLDSIQKLRK